MKETINRTKETVSQKADKLLEEIEVDIIEVFDIAAATFLKENPDANLEFKHEGHSYLWTIDGKSLEVFLYNDDKEAYLEYSDHNNILEDPYSLNFNFEPLVEAIKFLSEVSKLVRIHDCFMSLVVKKY